MEINGFELGLGRPMYKIVELSAIIMEVLSMRKTQCELEGCRC